MISIKTFVPKYFKEFSCIADKCPDTCCAGWEADLDDAIIKKYKTIDGELGKRIQTHLSEDETGCAIFALCENGRCPFLNDKNLCDIQAAYSEEYLSKTCALFPRFFDDFADIREMGLGFGCPEAARIMLNDNEPFRLYPLNDNDENTEDDEFYALCTNARQKIFDILETSSSDFKKKILKVFETASELQNEIDSFYEETEENGLKFDDCVSILSKMEYINKERQSLLSNLKDCDCTEIFRKYRNDFEKMMKYYIFRYFLQGCYCDDAVTPVKYGVFACIVISRMYAQAESLDFKMRAKIMQGYSKEIEYSDVNMDLLDTEMYERLSTDDLINLLF